MLVEVVGDVRVSRWTGWGRRVIVIRVGRKQRVLETSGQRVTARAGVEKFQTCFKRTGRVMEEEENMSPWLFLSVVEGWRELRRCSGGTGTKITCFPDECT
jgi:hypothetical protein